MYNTYFTIKVKQKIFSLAKYRPHQIDMREGNEWTVEFCVIKTPNQDDWVFLLHKHARIRREECKF